MPKSLIFHMIRATGGLALALGVIACGSQTESVEPTMSAPVPVEAPAAEPVEAPAPAVARPDVEGTVRVEVGDAIRFSVSRIEVTAGEKFRIELVHTGKMPKLAMGHNLVILSPGTDLPSFGLAAAQARATDFIPEGAKDSILAHTGLIGGGESSSLEMIAPAAGTYEFVCSFPGHFAVMRGQLIVRDAAASGTSGA